MRILHNQQFSEHIHIYYTALKTTNVNQYQTLVKEDD